MAKRNNKNNKEFKIPSDAKELAKLSFKKFKKESKGYYDSKKELKAAYYAHVIDLLPESIKLLVRYGHLDAVKETKEAIYAKITEKAFVKALAKELKNGLEMEELIYFPNVVYDILSIATKAVQASKEKGEDLSIDLDDLVELSQIILKKKIKKLKKAGVDENVAFDILSVIPTPKILDKSQYYHIREFFSVLYQHAKTKDIDFEKVMKVVFKGDDYVPSIITFALLERNEKISGFNDTQKKLFNSITEYCFKTMEDMKKDDIVAILKAYTEARKRDESQNKDTNRRYYISSLPESDYPRILKVVSKIIELDEDMKKYF